MSKEIPIVEFTPTELKTKTVSAESLELAYRMFSEKGCLVLKNVLDPALIQELHRDYIKTNSQYFTESDSPDALNVGNKRKMITVELKPPFSNEQLYANPFFFPVVNRILGGDCILGSFGSVVSMPGAEMQHIHFDHPHLFKDCEAESIMDKFPSFAITVVIPLVPINNETGPTRMWPGSHLLPRSHKKKIIEEGEYLDPTGEPGDCILFDYRLLHTGMPNKSNHVRPILYSIYYRPWFRDMVNYARQKPVVMSDENYQLVPDSYKKLFSWTLGDQWSIRAQADPTKKQPRNSPCHCNSGLKYKHCHGKLN